VVPGSHSQYAVVDANNCTWDLFDGFSSGGAVKDLLISPCAQNTNVVGYLGIPDAQAAVLGGATLVFQQGELPFAGTFLTGSTTATNTAYFNPLITGRYDWWSYEQLYYDSEI